MENETHKVPSSSSSPTSSLASPSCRLYTRRGDAGLTDLADGRRVSKTDSRISCVGILDELCCQIGLVVSLLPEEQKESLSVEKELLIQSQRFLFALGAWAAAVSHPQGLPTQSDIEALETDMDRMTAEIGSAFQGFVLPGGHPVAAHTHVARTICRKAERILLESGASDWPYNGEPMAYLNRLSDFLYALAKKINKLTGFAENKW